MKIDLEELRKAMALRSLINRTPLREIEIADEQGVVEWSEKDYDEFLFTGLSNINFFEAWKPSNRENCILERPDWMEEESDEESEPLHIVKVCS